MTCQGCGSKAPTQEVRLDFGRDFPFAQWCDNCVNKELERLKEEYMADRIDIEFFEYELDLFLRGVFT